MTRSDVLLLAAIGVFIVAAIAAQQVDGVVGLRALTWVAIGLALFAVSFFDVGHHL